MRKILLAALLLAVSLVLSACSISVGGGGTTNLDDQLDGTIPAQATTGTGDLAGEPSSVGSLTLAPGEERLYRVNVPANDADGFYVFTGAEVDLWLYRGDQRLYATADSGAYFAAGSAGLALTTSEASVAPQQMPTQACPGTCIIADNPDEGHVYVRVRNDGSSSASFGLWAVLRGFADENEAWSEADPEPFSGDADGAIETLGDVDHFVVESGGMLAFEAAEGAGIDFVAEIRDPFGDNPTRRVRPGDPAEEVFFEEVIRVYAENVPERAAVSANSEYYLFY